ncbi:DsrE family protein [Candidatus Magnetomonas plexicatena]|uniref:DsrE family protein n=1 Tax=Candidatus Magnetomonas plexicatena TaxID=2552947 RepID=UPI001C78E88D|nr:DsrE family protein [Nitrospirales bacterium LBB_01]
MGLNKFLPKKIIVTLCTILFSVLPATIAMPTSYPPSTDNIRIDIPVKQVDSKVVVNIGNDIMSGDLPLGIKYMTRIVKRFIDKNVNWKLSGVFYEKAGYMLLKDDIYNTKRQVSTGNPYKALILNLIKEGVSIEICALTMKAAGYTNNNLIEGVKVIDSAELRIIQLVQEHYIQIVP